MQTETLDKWVRADRARGPWLAKRLGYSREYIRLMARGARPIPREEPVIQATLFSKRLSLMANPFYQRNLRKSGRSQATAT